MDPDFSPRPHAEAVALLAGKPVVSKSVFNELLPELKARAFTVSGVASMDALQRIKDAVASVPMGAAGQTWDQAKRQIVDELDPYLGDGADWRATLILRTNGFQAFSTSIHNAGMADDDTTHFQYLHGECDVPTPSHLALNGIVLPKDDPFWETHTGPWGHLGCMCYVRTMNEDQVSDEKGDDEDRNPDAQRVITGPALKQLHHGDIIRDGVHYNVDYDGPDNSGFKWSPGDFKIPLRDLEKRYDPEVWSEFQTWAQSQMLKEDQSVWDWLSSTDEKVIANPLKGSKEKDDYANPNAYRENSERVFARGQAAFGATERTWGAALDGPSVENFKTQWSAQIAAVAVGRKPLFHEAIGPAAIQIASGLRKYLPPSVVVQATETDLFVYRPDVIGKLASGEQSLWEQVQAHADDGIWLGYGVNFPASPSMRANILDENGKIVSGFRVPADNPEKFAQTRALDFDLATGKPHTVVIIPG